MTFLKKTSYHKINCASHIPHFGDDRDILRVTLARQFVLLVMLCSVTRCGMGEGEGGLRDVAGPVVRPGVSHVGVGELVQGGGGGEHQGQHGEEEESHDEC